MSTEAISIEMVRAVQSCRKPVLGVDESDFISDLNEQLAKHVTFNDEEGYQLPDEIQAEINCEDYQAVPRFGSGQIRCEENPDYAIEIQYDYKLIRHIEETKTAVYGVSRK